jgi:hypothetical protein
VIASPADASLCHRLIVQHRGEVYNVNTAWRRVRDHRASPCEPMKSGTVRTYRATVPSGSSDALQVSRTFLRCACTCKRGRGLAGTVLLPYPARRASHPEARPWTPAGPPGDPLTPAVPPAPEAPSLRTAASDPWAVQPAVDPLELLGEHVQHRLAGKIPVTLVRQQNQPRSSAVALNRLVEPLRLDGERS